MHGHTPYNKEKTFREGLVHSNIYYASCRHGEVQSPEEYKHNGRQLAQRVVFLQGFTDLILRLKPPRCPSSSFQLTVVVVCAARLALVNCQAGSNKQPMWLWISSWPCLEAAVSAGECGGWSLGPDFESC